MFARQFWLTNKTKQKDLRTTSDSLEKHAIIALIIFYIYILENVNLKNTAKPIAPWIWLATCLK